MMFRRPPALADWLLHRLGDTQRNAALAGDLLEEFRAGRSAAWYWRQTLVVIAHAIAGNVRELRPYLLAIGAAYAAQFVVTMTLWSKNFPPALHASGWMKFGVWLLFQFGYAACWGLVNRQVVGRHSPNLKQMFCAVEHPTPRSTIMTLAACDSFSLGLANYCLCALIFTRFSLLGLLSTETAWFVLWIFAPALVPPSEAPVDDARGKDEEPWLAIPQSEPAVTVSLASGKTIVLERQSLAQSVFAAADRRLIDVVFGPQRSLELLRRAIWLGGSRSRSYIQGRAESFSLAELTALIDETARAKSIVEACHPPNRREGLRARLKRGFRGDPA
ncbi:MAG: hypothetical protein LAP40_14145 [Acidobacteriia bacterium]|nr:hypothetical protein [Terriglobia bacterium]